MVEVVQTGANNGDAGGSGGGAGTGPTGGVSFNGGAGNTPPVSPIVQG